MKEKINRTHWVHLRLKPEEYSQILGKFKNTTCRKLSDYLRKVLLNQPVTVNYRNQSLDDFMHEMLLLRNELNSLGSNFNQAVRKLHSLDQLAAFKIWIAAWDHKKEDLDNKIHEIKSKINEISDLWLR